MIDKYIPLEFDEFSSDLVAAVGKPSYFPKMDIGDLSPIHNPQKIQTPWRQDMNNARNNAILEKYPFGSLISGDKKANSYLVIGHGRKYPIQRYINEIIQFYHIPETSESFKLIEDRFNELHSKPLA